MQPDKSSGPDGMSPGFYQKHWHILGEDITGMVQDYLDTGTFADKLTDTNIVLVPKKSNPVSMQDLRPISLCNVIYKVVSKVLANRLKEVIGLIISENHSAFIPGRLITDNVMISHEVKHYMRRKIERRTGWMALKLDMSKVYDRVEWGYLRAALCKLGFHETVVNRLMLCVTSVKYRICHAGREFGIIVPGRGLRQGDPLLSYLFLICMEGFTTIMNRFERNGLLGGIKVARGAPAISHILFAKTRTYFARPQMKQPLGW